jgi:hypothetical protein
LHLQNCDEDEVISLNNKLFKLHDLKSALQKIFSQYKLEEEFNKSLNVDLGIKVIVENGRYRRLEVSKQQWLLDGIDCEMLQIEAKGWQKGKIKINLQVSLEFCPNEPEIEKIESPLDDLRKIIDGNN